MRRVAQVVALGCPLLVAFCAPALAQGWPSWADRAFGDRGSDSRSYGRWREPDRYEERNYYDERKSRPLDGDIRDGGLRPAIAPQAPPVVAFPHSFPANSIVIDTGGRKLYYVLADSRAYEYSVSVGREGFNWNGSETVSRKQDWPDWHPPAEMRERDPSLPEKMTGGVKNPARRDGALSRHDTLSHPWHQRREVDRARRILRLLPHVECLRPSSGFDHGDRHPRQRRDFPAAAGPGQPGGHLSALICRCSAPIAGAGSRPTAGSNSEPIGSIRCRAGTPRVARRRIPLHEVGSFQTTA